MSRLPERMEDQSRYVTTRREDRPAASSPPSLSRKKNIRAYFASRETCLNTSPQEQAQSCARNQSPRGFLSRSALLAREIAENNHIVPMVAQAKPSRLKKGTPHRVGPVETAITTEEPTITAATTIPTTNRLTAPSS